MRSLFLCSNMNDKDNIILFDGICNLCNGTVQFIIRHDKRKKFRYASLQSSFAQNKIKSFVDKGKHFESVVLLLEDEFFFKIDAVIKIGIMLGFPWNLICITKVIPKKLRDLIYDFVAGHRYGWFGKREKCMIPKLEHRSLFLD